MIMHPGIKLRHIRAFLDIASEASLSAVARAQGITQPALSRSLAELEAMLGEKLFHRQGRRLVLTEAGAVFRRHASLGLQALETGAAALRPGGDAGGRLRVGVLPTAATRLFPRVAMRFQALAPHWVLALETGPHAYLVRLLREGRIDLMVGRLPVATDMADLRFDHLYEDDVVLAARAGHPMLGRPAAEIIAAQPLILPPVDAIIRRAVDDYLAALGMTGRRAAFETVALPVGRGIVRGSDALWFISRGVIQDELDQGLLVTIPVELRFLSGAVGLTRRQSQVEPPGLDLLCTLLRDEARLVHP